MMTLDQVKLLGKVFSIGTAALGMTGAHDWAAVKYVESRNALIHAYEAKVESKVAALAKEHGFVARPLSVPEIREFVKAEANRQGVPVAMALALIHVESGFRNAISEAGAVGITQVMAFNAKYCGLTPTQLTEEKPNISCGIKILRRDWIAEHYNTDRALQRYNGGPGCINVCKQSIEHSSKVRKQIQIEESRL